ncbi:MAG: DUF501 domain-containing protein [Actinobacteria bacterium]|nr:MAG: DUF501 domain-containing protein [Actinomycetota bacterium]
MGVERKDLVEQQLGRKPRGQYEIVAWCKTKPPHPQVIKTNPLVEGKPFPTLYYLTCPFLVKEISRIENEGYISKLEEKISRDTEYKVRFLKAQAAYIKERGLLSKGIAGVSNLERIKCLHAHYAHYLATGENPVGKQIEKLIISGSCHWGSCDKSRN